jgi:hypothetical protein
MSTIEDRLRAATKAAADTVAPGTEPPLMLPGRRATAARWRRRPRQAGWLAPAAAAAAVAAVIGTSVSVSTVIHAHRPAAQHPADGPFAGLPAYYLTLASGNPAAWPRRAVIRATGTGTVTATVTPPRPYRIWEQAAASGNGHDFVLEAARQRMSHSGGGIQYMAAQPKFFLLTVGQNGRRPRLAALPVPSGPTREAASFALSPDGSKLALVPGSIPEIGVFSVATGAGTWWRWPHGPRVTNNAGADGEVLSWTADGRTLAFQQWVNHGITIRLLDTTTPGGSLLASSRVGMRWPNAGDPVRFVNGKIVNDIFGFSAIITPDGTKIVAATSTETRRPLNSELQFTEFAVGTGTVQRVLYPWRLPGLYPGQVQDVLWSSPSGSKLIVVAHPPGTKPTRARNSPDSAGYPIELGVVSGTHFTPLPGAPSLRGPGPWPVW